MQTAPTKKKPAKKKKKKTHIISYDIIYTGMFCCYYYYTHIYTYDIYIYIFADRIIHVNFINSLKSDISLQIQQANIHPKEK